MLDNRRSSQLATQAVPSSTSKRRLVAHHDIIPYGAFGRDETKSGHHPCEL